MAELHEIVTPRDERKRSVKETLETALSREFVEVVIVGVCEDGTWNVAASNIKSHIHTVGMLEFAKHDVLASAEEL